ncbi:MAG: Response regulator receiver protein [Candidatus Azambacteria bacterium GW2011_GWD2_46_48]|nr:MAG: Response regulator receiver protein [Candidatus Azambacteria bacterium GW2011_GWD2_46_48]
MLNALDGEIGLQMALREKPDLILLDLILPKIDGFEVLENIRKNEATKNIPVIVLTNLENAAAVERALALGALSYLVKANYELEDVVQKVKQAIK